MNAATFSGTSAANAAANLSRSRNSSPLTGGRIGGTGAPGGGSAISEPTDSPVSGARPLAPPALHIRQGPGADPRYLGQLLQRQPRRAPMTAQHLTETRMISDREDNTKRARPGAGDGQGHGARAGTGRRTRTRSG